MPDYRLDAVPKVPGVDGQKMSKSYGNTIEIFAEPNVVKKRVMSIVTDATPVEAPKNPETCNVFALYSLFATEAEKNELAGRYRAGGLGYGEVKKLLLEKINTFFGPARETTEGVGKQPRGGGGIAATGGSTCPGGGTLRRWRWCARLWE